ncbi:SOS response-associated peptidase [Vannielia litorea]|uniref:SOS response-associated peptidase n=1 Tax=Vannielia litorea TaxID=1217970 RepID=UPI001C95089A|nr:SOS response-associated peptidase [Vannielia litorea]MBY6048607.1 SOS response-associated peptidase [Vannielia litorea]MBY6076021.1 SOS response-associated peptidase [Vannielia litorea]
MPGRLFLTRPGAEVAEAFGSDWPEGQGPRANIAPGQQVVVWDGAALRLMRWGMIPVGRVNARGRPVMETIVNARSETVFAKSAFENTRRGVVPCDGWYEWTGKARRKQPWRIAPKDGSLLGFAAIWDVWTAPNGAELAQVATVTCAPNGDVAPIHHRMGVILAPHEWPLWCGGNTSEAQALCHPWPDGRLEVAHAEGVDWSGA